MGFHDKRRHWYHLSSKLDRRGKFVLEPWGGDKAVNRDFAEEPEGKRISVAPTIPQCLAALPQQGLGHMHVYRTYYKVKSEVPEGVFDAKITQEGWLTRPIKFVYIGTIDFDTMEDELGNQFWPDDAACDTGDGHTSEDALKDWRELLPAIRKYTEVLI
jgi:hypothetical protein